MILKSNLVINMQCKLKELYGEDSIALDALDLLIKTMNKDNGYVRDDGSDYYTHPISVANIVLEYGITNQDVIVAALLHDIIEDVRGYKKYMLELRFNLRVAELVELETKKHNVDYKNEKTFNEYIIGISQDPEAAIIKTADRLHNLSTLTYRTKDYKCKKINKTKKFFLPLLRKCIIKYPKYRLIFILLYNRLNELIFEIQNEVGKEKRETSQNIEKVSAR